jgi:hypothetical protein
VAGCATNLFFVAFEMEKALSFRIDERARLQFYSRLLQAYTCLRVSSALSFSRILGCLGKVLGKRRRVFAAGAADTYFS